jgi:iron complex outermembrane recepter protein
MLWNARRLERIFAPFVPEGKAMSARQRLLATLLTTTVLCSWPGAALAQAAAPAKPAKAEEEVIVTAQKREERLQNVPISIQALSTTKLDQLNIGSFNDYAALLPSVSFQTSSPGNVNVYIRGVASGGDGNHSGPLPSVGVYLDEQPITTIGGAVDVHIYDIARIESLAGPQGTLYGASSQAGTIRIITNKPEFGKTVSRLDFEANKVLEGGVGGKIEGMVNLPISDRAAVRLVGFVQRDAGYIDNVFGTRTFLGAPAGGGFAPGISVNNRQFVDDDFNSVDKAGGRAALRVDLNDNWTATATVMGQDQQARGVFGQAESVGDLKVQRFYPDKDNDRFYQAALTLEGRIANFDVTYAGAYLWRKIDSISDYTDYAEAYDQLYAGVGGVANYFYFQDSTGANIDPRQYIVGGDRFNKMSHELRVASPADNRLRVVAGAYYQRQTHDILQDYIVPGLAPALSVNGRPGSLWLTDQRRIDRDTAVFGELSFDIVKQLTLTAGVRAYEYENSLIGFFGFGRNPAGAPFNAAGSSRTGVAGCFTTTGAILRDNPGGALLPTAVGNGPCTNLADVVGGQLKPKFAKGDGTTYRVNLTYKPTDYVMFYATSSTGFRPGGINRRAGLSPYQADELKNLELGWKTTLLDGALRFNGAIYQQTWEKFQFAFLGLNSFTEIRNGPDAEIKGVEADVFWAPLDGLTLNMAASYTDAKTKQNLCRTVVANFACTGPDIQSPKGTRLPVTPKVKASASVRYTWDVGNISPFLQGLVVYQDEATSDLRAADAVALGKLPSYTTLDLAGGWEWKNFTTELFVDNVTDERAEISRTVACSVCYNRTYAIIAPPRTVGVRFGSKF